MNKSAPDLTLAPLFLVREEGSGEEWSYMITQTTAFSGSPRSSRAPVKTIISDLSRSLRSLAANLPPLGGECPNFPPPIFFIPHSAFMLHSALIMALAPIYKIKVRASPAGRGSLALFASVKNKSGPTFSGPSCVSWLRGELPLLSRSAFRAPHCQGSC